MLRQGLDLTQRVLPRVAVNQQRPHAVRWRLLSLRASFCCLPSELKLRRQKSGQRGVCTTSLPRALPAVTRVKLTAAGSPPSG
jgi:hypothetical protein